jgi:hypothetical protein
MNQRLFRFSRELACLGAFALLLSGCSAAGEQPASQQPAPDVGVSPESLVAGLWITDTHWVGFYELEDGNLMALERFHMDNDTPVLAGQQIEPGQYASAYKRIAGSAVDQAMLVRLEALDAKIRLSTPAHADTEPNVEPGPQDSDLRRPPEGQLVEKDFWSDIGWFSSNFCNGCLGTNGTRQGWEPASFPTCTTAPEVCSATWQYGVLYRKSKNATARAFNHGFSPATFGIYYADSCENSTWWERNVQMDCHYWGRRIVFLDLPARNVGWATMTNSQSWTREYEVNGPAEMAFMIDTY